MRDPEMVSRANRAAVTLERAWERWRLLHGLPAAPRSPVSSYVGYSMEEPWGSPRVVFGVDASEAELLAAVLDRHQCAGLYYQPGPAAGELGQAASQVAQPARAALPPPYAQAPEYAQAPAYAAPAPAQQAGGREYEEAAEDARRPAQSDPRPAADAPDAADRAGVPVYAEAAEAARRRRAQEGPRPAADAPQSAARKAAPAAAPAAPPAAAPLTAPAAPPSLQTEALFGDDQLSLLGAPMGSGQSARNARQDDQVQPGGHAGRPANGHVAAGSDASTSNGAAAHSEVAASGEPAASGEGAASTANGAAEGEAGTASRAVAGAGAPVTGKSVTALAVTEAKAAAAELSAAGPARVSSDPAATAGAGDRGGLAAAGAGSAAGAAPGDVSVAAGNGPASRGDLAVSDGAAAAKTGASPAPRVADVTGTGDGPSDRASSGEGPGRAASRSSGRMGDHYPGPGRKDVPAAAQSGSPGPAVHVRAGQIRVGPPVTDVPLDLPAASLPVQRPSVLGPSALGPPQPDDEGIAGPRGKTPARETLGEPPAHSVRERETVDGEGAEPASHTIAAELAGWASGELPGQASARLAAWEAIGGVPAPDARQASSAAAADALGPNVLATEAGVPEVGTTAGRAR